MGSSIPLAQYKVPFESLWIGWVTKARLRLICSTRFYILGGGWIFPFGPLEFVEAILYGD
jgi:hypothetical protein